MTSIEHDFDLARKRLQKTESGLTRALDGLSAAYESGNPSLVTPAKKQAKEAWRLCSLAWESVERARQAFWMQHVKRATEELNTVVPPPLAKIVTCSRYAYSLAPAMPNEILRHLAGQPLPPMAAIDTTVPTAPLESAALIRAEDEFF